MSSDNAFDEQKAANLARIRDNQRRSRARRKEYLLELEERYRVCEQLGVEASAEMQAAARRVIEENRRLRIMLRQHGYTDAAVDQAVHDGVSQVSPVAGLEALFGQRKRMPPTAAAAASSSSSSSAIPLVVGAPPGQYSAGLAGAAILQPSLVEDVAMSPSSSTVTAQQSTPYGGAGQWPNIYPQGYASQSSARTGDAINLTPSHHFGVPSLQSIKTEIGYDPQQEEIDSQSADAEYALSDEQYDMMKRYPQ